MSGAVALTLAWAATGVIALPPAPPNDDPLTPEVLDPNVPTIVYGTTVLGDNSISTTTLPAPADDVDGPDVYYSFTPNTSDTYRIQLMPWHRAPLRSSDRRFIIYVQDGDGIFLGGAQAPGNARPFNVDVALTAGSTYRIGVDYDASTHDNFPFTLVVDTLAATAPDDCATVQDLATTLPTAVLQDIDGATADYLFEQGTGQCAVSGSTPTTAAGIDHVYRFTPTVTGSYAFELAVNGFDGVLYINTSCPPVFPGGCLGASNHSTSASSGGKHELIVTSMDADTDYYIFVDNGSTTLNTGSYALIVDTAFGYEMSEEEPNGSFATATPVGTPLNGGQLVGPTDVDWWSVSGDAGDRVYAWVNNGGSSNSTLDTDLGFFAADGSTMIEFDDEDADGANAPIEDLRFIYSTTAPVIAGAKMTSSGDHYLRVTDQNATGTVSRYRFHVGVQPGTRNPLSECEPNNSFASADSTAKRYYSGVVDIVGDVDFYSFEAEVGDRVFIACDGDPERDADGFISPQTDPKAFHAKLIVYDPAQDILISDISDSNSIQSGPDYPAQGGFFVARTTGTHYVSVQAQSSASSVGPEETYELAIFIDSSAADMLEDVDPVVTLTPDFLANEIGVLATDNAPGDSGVCSVELVGATNIELTGLSFTPGDGIVNFTITLINPAESGFGKLVVADCEGSTNCGSAKIDVNPPICGGLNFSQRLRTTTHAPLHVPNNQPAGPGIDSAIEIASPGAVSHVTVTLTIETIRPPDIDCFLISPSGTMVELFTDRGSSLAFDITDATFDDDAEEILPILSGDAPYTGTWLPEDPLGFAQLNGEPAQGAWKLRVIDDSSSAGGGARLIRWTLDVNAGFPGPESFAGAITDTQGFDCGIASIELVGGSNVEFTLTGDFQIGDQTVDYIVTLIDPNTSGSGTIVVTDLAENECISVLVLNGLPDVTNPTAAGAVSTERVYGAEVQANVPGGVPAGVTSTVVVADSALVGEVEVDLVIDTKDVGRLASTLSHDGAFASLVNRVGMDDRGSVGLTKDIIEITLDDDAPPEDDAHEEPASGAIEFFGPHQPDGRGEFIGDAITTDPRDHMLFTLAGAASAGAWDLFVADFRIQGAGSAKSVFRRWSMTIKNPCGAEKYVGFAEDFTPGTGICTVGLAAGATNLALITTFDPGAERVTFEVVLVDESVAGSGSLEIADCVDNITAVAIDLLPNSPDVNLPVITGMLNLATFQYEGTATEVATGDTGIAAVELAPYSHNLEIVSLDPDPPSAATVVTFVIGLIDPGANGRGYVRVTDGCSLRSVQLIEIDATVPVCSGSVGTTKRYVSQDTPIAIPDNTGVVLSFIEVLDTDIITDVNVTLNINHTFDDDITVRLTSPLFIDLFSDIGSVGNDFIDTTIDDEADAPIPDSSSEAPFTGSYQPEGGPALFALDGLGADANWVLQVLDDAVFNTGTLESWAVTIESETFPQRYDGRVEDGEEFGAGVCDISLLGDAVNLLLMIDTFSAGDSIVRYSVDTDCGQDGGKGSGTVRVTDCAGNVCDVPVVLSCGLCPDAGTPLAAGISPCVDDNDCDNTAVCKDGECYVPKLRYLSIHPQSAGEQTALRVTHTASGRQWWVGVPEPNGVSLLENDLAPAMFRDWGADDIALITGCGIVTDDSYDIQAIHMECDIADDDAYSLPVTLPTGARWGDVIGDFADEFLPPDGFANLFDVFAVVLKFQGDPIAPSLSWADLAGETPNRVVNLEDAFQSVLGFQGAGYPYSLPADCP